MYRVSGFIELELGSKRLAESLARALRVEALSPPDPERGSVRIVEKEDRIVLEIEARDLSAARTLYNTYLSLVATILSAIKNVERGLVERNTESLQKTY